MDQVRKIWDEQIGNNPIEGISLEIVPARRISANIISHELSGDKFNEVLADFALLEIWSNWCSSTCSKYYLKDMTLVLQGNGLTSVSLNRTIYQQYLRKTMDHLVVDTQSSNPIEGNLSNLPSNKDVFCHPEIKAQPLPKADVTTSLHLKCVRKIPMAQTAFPPIDKYHAIERIAFRYYDHVDFSVYFQIARPAECAKSFEELLVSWQGSRFSIRIVVKNPRSDVLQTVLSYLGWQ